MPGVPDTNEPAWETFLTLLEPIDEAPPSAQVAEEELKRHGIDVKNAQGRVLAAVHLARARAELERAKARLPSVRDQILKKPVTVPCASRDHLKILIAERCEASARTAYFRKLEAAASDADLQTLLEDLELLDAIPEDGQSGQNSGK